MRDAVHSEKMANALCRVRNLAGVLLEPFDQPSPGGCWRRGYTNEKNAIKIAEAIAALGFKSRQGHEDRRPSVNRVRVSDRLRSARFWQSHTVGRHCRRFATVLERSRGDGFRIKSGSKN